MANVHDQFVGISDETVYGTAVAVNRFLEFTDESIDAKYERIQSEAIRQGGRVVHKDRFVPNPKGAEGKLELEVLDKVHHLLFKHMLGQITVGTQSGGFYPWTGVFGALDGKSLTCQVARLDSTGTLIPFTYSGGKVTEWELSNSVDELLKLSLSLDFAGVNNGAGAGASALATPTYPTGAQVLSFIGGTVQVDSAEVPVSEVKIASKNGLKVDRYSMRTGATTKREPKETELREISWEFKGEFESMTLFNKVAATTAAGALGNIVLNWASPSGSGLEITIPYARFDSGPLKAERDITALPLSGIAMGADSGSPITFVYKTADAAL